MKPLVFQFSESIHPMKSQTTNNRHKYSNHHKQRLFFQLMTILIMFFIWSNSLQPASASSSMSTGILAMLQDLWLQIFKESFPVSHHLLRKLGHFSEFLLLGIFATLGILTGKKAIQPLKYKALYFGLLTALIDETIQYFSPGRSPEVADILIDYSGFCCGFLIIYMILKKYRTMYQHLA